MARPFCNYCGTAALGCGSVAKVYDLEITPLASAPVMFASMRFFPTKFQPDRLMPTKPIPVSSPAARIRIGACTLGTIIGKLIDNVKWVNLWLLLRLLEFRL